MDIPFSETGSNPYKSFRNTGKNTELPMVVFQYQHVISIKIDRFSYGTFSLMNLILR